jgi:hypothetical protein
MWNIVKDVASVVSDIATALAFIAVAAQLWIIRRQLALDAQVDFDKTEQQIWRTALQDGSATKLLEEFWDYVPGATPAEELLFISLMDNYRHAYMRYKAGFLGTRSWAPLEGYILDVLSTERGQELWRGLKKIFPEDYVGHFDKALRRRGPGTHRNTP